MKRLIVSILSVSNTIIHPMAATEILPAMECHQNPMQFMEGILCSSGTFDADKARRFLFQLKREVKEQHGIDLDLNLVMNEAVRCLLNTGKFSQAEIDIAKKFYSQLIEPEIRVSNSWKFGKKKHKQKHKKGQEFVLPDKMAIGFICILSGSLLCILPFGITQGIGTGLIGTGIYAVIDGAREGEKPYYIDSETGQPLPSTQH